MTGQGRGRCVGPRRSCAARGARRGEGDTPWSQSPEIFALLPPPPPPPRCTPRIFRAPQPPGQRRGRAAVVEALRSRRRPAGARRGSPPGDAAASPVAVPLRARPKQLREEEAAALGARALRSRGLTATPHAPVRSPRGQAGLAGRPLGSLGGSLGRLVRRGGKHVLQSLPVSPSPSGRDGLREWVTASDTAPWSWCRQSCAERGGKGSRSLFLISVNDCGDGVVRGRPEECVCVRDRRRGWERGGAAGRRCPDPALL